ncbi:unnamed protein product [Moneuplotes crassus]|uniref:Uncharacterized protein n=1 Tax=Euplotes crassus TaxID=5936 RepID=A0AAD1XWI2_EUPCR|nr:unnamed protein product [Moneuplotes crassus]
MSEKEEAKEVEEVQVLICEENSENVEEGCKNIPYVKKSKVVKYTSDEKSPEKKMMSPGGLDLSSQNLRKEGQPNQLLEVNRRMLRKIFNRHVFCNKKKIKTAEVNKICMSLNIFPDLLTNVEITRIICEIQPEPSSNLMKSPRMLNKEVMMKDYLLSYTDFEKLLVKVAVRAFKAPSEQSEGDSLNADSFRTDINDYTEALYHLLNHIRDPSKVLYGVKINTQAFEKSKRKSCVKIKSKQGHEKNEDRAKARMSLTNPTRLPFTSSSSHIYSKRDHNDGEDSYDSKEQDFDQDLLEASELVKRDISGPRGQHKARYSSPSQINKDDEVEDCAAQLNNKMERLNKTMKFGKFVAKRSFRSSNPSYKKEKYKSKPREPYLPSRETQRFMKSKHQIPDIGGDEFSKSYSKEETKSHTTLKPKTKRVIKNIDSDTFSSRAKQQRKNLPTSSNHKHININKYHPKTPSHLSMNRSTLKASKPLRRDPQGHASSHSLIVEKPKTRERSTTQKAIRPIFGTQSELDNSSITQGGESLAKIKSLFDTVSTLRTTISNFKRRHEEIHQSRESRPSQDLSMRESSSNYFTLDKINEEEVVEEKGFTDNQLMAVGMLKTIIGFKLKRTNRDLIRYLKSLKENKEELV